MQNKRMNRHSNRESMAKNYLKHQYYALIKCVFLLTTIGQDVRQYSGFPVDPIIMSRLKDWRGSTEKAVRKTRYDTTQDTIPMRPTRPTFTLDQHLVAQERCKPTIQYQTHSRYLEQSDESWSFVGYTPPLKSRHPGHRTLGDWWAVVGGA